LVDNFRFIFSALELLRRIREVISRKQNKRIVTRWAFLYIQEDVPIQRLAEEATGDALRSAGHPA
jgi:hypothetical protein